MKQVILKRRAMIAPGHMRVKIGDRVERDTVLAELDYVPGSMQRLDVAGFLGINPLLIEEKMCVSLGGSVAKGDIIAENMEFGSVKEILSPLDGSIALISKYMGCIYLRKISQQATESKPIVYLASDFNMSNKDFIADFLPMQEKVKEIPESGAGSSDSFIPSGMEVGSGTRLLIGNGIIMAGQRLFKSNELVAPYTCRITVIAENEGRIEMVPMFQKSQLHAHLSGFIRSIPEIGACVIASYGHRFQGTVGYGDEASGTIYPLIDRECDLDEGDISDDLTGCIVVTRGGASLAALRKLTEYKIAGLVLGKLDLDILAEFSEQEPLLQLGHLMSLPFPIILYQGYEGVMPATVFREIATLQGQYALIDASTQMRAGVSRPELIVPLDGETELLKHKLVYEKIEMNEEVVLKSGDQVFLTRSPYAGQHALLVSIGSKLEATLTGTRVVLAEVRLADNTIVFLPLANCTKIMGGESSHD